MKTLWIMVGLPGSGKSWFAKNKLMQGSNWAYVSRDEIRFSMLNEDEDYFAHEDKVYKSFVEKLSENLNNVAVTDVIADATHLNWASRVKLLNGLARNIDTSQVNVVPVVVTASFETCVRRNNERSGRAVVPKGVIRRMSYQLTDPKKDEYEYKSIWYVKNEEELKIEYEYT